MEKFLAHKLLKLTQEETDKLDSSVSTKRIEFVI